MTKTQSFQTPWYDKTVKALQLGGMGESTQKSYARAVLKLIESCDKDPLIIMEEVCPSEHNRQLAIQPAGIKSSSVNASLSA